MFDIGFSELLMFGIIALVVLGPEKLPQAARAAGKWYSKARRTVSNLQHEIEAELDLAETRKKMQEELAKIREAEAQMQQEMQALRGSMKKFEQENQQALNAQSQPTQNTKTKTTADGTPPPTRSLDDTYQDTKTESIASIKTNDTTKDEIEEMPLEPLVNASLNPTEQTLQKENTENISIADPASLTKISTAPSTTDTKPDIESTPPPQSTPSNYTFS